MATVKKQSKKPAVPRFLIRAHTLTPETDAFLQQLGQEASDRVGWKVSGSAIVRALLRHAKGQGTAWAADTLFPLIEGGNPKRLCVGLEKRELITHYFAVFRG